MWIAICDNCKSPNCVFGRNKEQQVWRLGKYTIQDAEIHACSRECAEHLDQVEKNHKIAVAKQETKS